MNIRNFVFILLLTACASAPALPVTVTPTATRVPTATFTPTIMPSPTATQTMKEAIYPYTIQGLRKHDFKSGKITLGEKLLETDSFTRYAITYPSDGLTITGILQIPKTGKSPYPVIILNHGFFSRYVYASGDGTDRAAEFFNKRGYLTLSSDYRSWGKSDFGVSLFYSGLAIDVVNLMNALPSLKEADPERVGMWGHSMGGGVTLKVLEIDSRVKAAVLYSPVSADFADIIERWGTGCYGDVLIGEQVYGCNSSDVVPETLPHDLSAGYFKASADPAMLQAVSPFYYLDYVNAPVQIHYGVDDGKVMSGTPPEWSKSMYMGLISAGKQAALFAYAGEKHSFSPKQWFPFMERCVFFFDQYLKNP